MTERSPLAHTGAQESAQEVASAVAESLVRALAPLLARLDELERRLTALERAPVLGEEREGGPAGRA
jgi:hypothetical protein